VVIYDTDGQLIRQVDYRRYLKTPGRIVSLALEQDKLLLYELNAPTEAGDLYQYRFYEIDPLRTDEATHLINYYVESATSIRFAIAPNGDFWQTGHTGLRRIVPHTEVFPSGAPEMVGSLHAIAEAANGDVLLGGYGTGFTRYNGETLYRERNNSLVKTRQVMPGSFRDTDGNLLFMNEFGGPGRGIIRLSPTGDLSPIPVPYLNGDNLTGYHFSKVRLPISAPVLRGKEYPTEVDSVDQLAVSLVGNRISDAAPNWGNIALLDLPVRPNADVRLITGRQGIRTRNVLCTAQDRAGRIWFGHGSTGIGVYDPVRDTAMTWRVEKAVDPGAVAMVVDRHDRLWLASSDGVYYVDSASTIALQPAPHLRSRRKKCLLREVPDSYVPSLLLRGDTLIVGHGGGVSFIDISGQVAEPPTVTFPLPDFGMGHAEQNALLIDREGWLWIGGYRSETVPSISVTNYRSLISNLAASRRIFFCSTIWVTP